MDVACADCKSSNMIQDGERGELYCADCGVVAADRMGDPTEYLGDTHAPPLQAGNTTVMGGAPPGRAGSARLRMRDRWIASHGVASSMRGGALSRMRAMHDKLGLPESVFERAVAIYKRITTAKDCRGRHLPSVMAASLYVACREADAPRTLSDVAGVTGMPVKAVSKYVRFVLEHFGSTPRQYSLPVLITRGANAVGSGLACRRLAVEMVAKLEDSYLAGKSPLVVAAAILYVAALRESAGYSARQVASAFGVTEISVRKRSREMNSLLGTGD